MTSSTPSAAIPPSEGLETALRHLVRDVPSAPRDGRAGDVRKRLIGQSFGCATDVAVLDGQRLAGMIPIERLLAAGEETRLRDLMDPDPAVVHPGTDQEIAAWKAVEHGESSLPVVDPEGRFLGVLPARVLLGVMLQEHHEDLARASGLVKPTGDVAGTLREPLLRRLLRRVPWLLIGLGGALLSADVMAAFEGALKTNLALAFFLPGLVYLADAVGTQTETLVVRGLSLRLPMGAMMAREAVSGVLIGLGLAVLALGAAALRWGSGPMPWVIAISVAAACSTASITGIALPWLLQRLGRDPAFGSGPLATVIQDLLSILIYLGVATLVLPPR